MSIDDHAHGPTRREEGVALIVTVVTLLVATMIGLTALLQTQEESTAGGRARSAARTLQAADAGVQFAISRLSEVPPNLNGFSVNLTNATFESRRRDQGSLQPLVEVASGGAGAGGEGYAINIGSGTGLSSRIYRVNITATSGSSVAEIETLVSQTQIGGSTY